MNFEAGLEYEVGTNRMHPKWSLGHAGGLCGNAPFLKVQKWMIWVWIIMEG